jgi:ribosome biogenesis GTPase
MAEGKIIKALSGFYYVKDGTRVIECRGRGVFRNQNIVPLVGDLVVYQSEGDREGYIMDILPRENELLRPPIANVDQAILVFSVVEPEFNIGLLDRFLVLIEDKQIKPLICLTKLDLLPDKKKNGIEQYAAYYRSIGYHVLLTSSITEEGLEDLLPFIDDKISVFAGQSGVGKSTLLNALKPDLLLKTDKISTHLGRGKHTTRHVELIEIANGLVADTPGFSSLEFTEIEAENLTFCFPEIKEESSNCKFRGCLHLNEPKCAVKQAVEENRIESFRYKHYLSFLQEIRDRKPRY